MKCDACGQMLTGATACLHPPPEPQRSEAEWQALRDYYTASVGLARSTNSEDDEKWDTLLDAAQETLARIEMERG